MPDKDTANSTFIQLFFPVSSFLKTNQTKFTSNAYVKKMTTQQLIQLLILAQLEQHRSLRSISARLNCKEFNRVLNLDSISHSQISRRLRALDPRDVELIFQGIVRLINTDIGVRHARNLLGRLNLMDASTISLCLSRSPWASFRKHKGGVKLHLGLRFMSDASIPEQVKITPARLSDRSQMDSLVVEDPEIINVFDRGYLDYAKFHEFNAKKIRFVTRLKNNTIVEVLDEFLITDLGIIKDQLVILGGGPKQMSQPLRLIETTDSSGKPVVFATNVWDLTASEIALIYRQRWQIELFFKWVKQHLVVKHFYGLSQRATENQILIALISYCLGLWLKEKSKAKGTLLSFIRILKNCLTQPYADFLRLLRRKAFRFSKGRRKLREQIIYQFTVDQVFTGEFEHLDDLFYDPLVC